jgi:hypothetical protein
LLSTRRVSEQPLRRRARPGPTRTTILDSTYAPAMPLASWQARMTRMRRLSPVQRNATRARTLSREYRVRPKAPNSGPDRDSDMYAMPVPRPPRWLLRTLAFGSPAPASGRITIRHHGHGGRGLKLVAGTLGRPAGTLCVTPCTVRGNAAWAPGTLQHKQRAGGRGSATRSVHSQFPGELMVCQLVLLRTNLLASCVPSSCTVD